MHNTFIVPEEKHGQSGIWDIYCAATSSFMNHQKSQFYRGKIIATSDI